MILSLQISACKIKAHHEQLRQVLSAGNRAWDAPAQQLGGEGRIRAAQLPAAGSYEQLNHGKLVSHEQSRAITGSPKVCMPQHKRDAAFRSIYDLQFLLNFQRTNTNTNKVLSPLCGISKHKDNPAPAELFGGSASEEQVS